MKNVKDYTELVFILDRSGSMGGLERDTIGGFNSVLRKNKEQEGDAIVSTVLFDDRIASKSGKSRLSRRRSTTSAVARHCSTPLAAPSGT